jgi:hypothetical protein
MLAEVIRIRRTLRRRAAAQALASVAPESERG